MLTMRTPEHQNDVIDVALMFLLLNFNIFTAFPSDYIVDFEQVNACWVAAFPLEGINEKLPISVLQ